MANSTVGKMSKLKHSKTITKWNFTLHVYLKAFLQTETIFDIGCEIKIKTQLLFVSMRYYSRLREVKIYLEKPIEKETRQTILKLAKIYDLPVFQDITNFSFHSSRNKIRHIVFPFLGSIFQKKVNFSLSHFFEILKQEK